MTEPTLETVINELRELFPHEQVVVHARILKRQIDYGIQIGVKGNDFDGYSLRRLMEQVRKWKEREESDQ